MDETPKKRDAFDRIPAYYQKLVEKYGHDPRACDYGQSESQRTKFDVIATAIRRGDERLLDIGCGFADFLDYLRARHPRIGYTGIDISDAMVSEARRFHPGTEILLGNFLDAAFTRKFDLVTANGIFYLLGADANALMRQIVRKMYELAEDAVVFNSLSAWAPDLQAGEFYADPAATLEYCRTLTPWVCLRHDYHRRDFTVFLYKQKSG